MYLLRNKMFGFLSLFTVLVSILFIPVYNIIFLDLPSVGEVNNCPLCFGREFCSCLSRENFTLNWDHFLINVLSICSRKNHIIFGKYGEDLVVVKKRPFDFSQNKVNFSRVVDFTGLLESLEQTSLKQQLDIHKKFTFCYSYRKLVTDFFENVAKKENNVTEVYLNLFFIVLTNMEPIIQQVTKNWAVAEYLGSCGDFTVSRYCGYSLTWVMPQLDWTTRSSVAVQLLQFAFNATFSHPQFTFYFTDMSPDNFAVSSDGKVRLVDLEHVIVVDKYPEDPPENWKIQHQSFHDESVSGFAFSTQEICSHQTSDMNIYSICQGILSEKSDLLDGGLLHSPPQHMLDITRMIRACVSPPTGKTRFDIAESIIQVLDVSQFFGSPRLKIENITDSSSVSIRQRRGQMVEVFWLHEAK